MVAVHSEGDGVEVDSGNVTMTKSFRKRTVVACSEAGVKVAACFGAEVKVAACSEAGVKVVACSGAGIEDDRWWRQRSDF
jgi:hypothetical protein